MISFELLYRQDSQSSLPVFLVWANDVIAGLDLDEVVIHQTKIQEFIDNIREDEFPANGGFSKASPFKKASNIFVWLMAINPFGPADEIGFRPHTLAAIVGFGIVQHCLHNAEFTNRDGARVVLKKKIKVSDHFYKDFLEAAKGITPESHFKTYSLLFESLCYQVNPDASYAQCL